jgi:hypothetical protein
LDDKDEYFRLEVKIIDHGNWWKSDHILEAVSVVNSLPKSNIEN